MAQTASGGGRRMSFVVVFSILILGIAILAVWYKHDKRKTPVCRDCQDCKYNNWGECESTILCESGEMCEPMEDGGEVK